MIALALCAAALAAPGPLRLEPFVLEAPARVTQRHTTDFDGDGLADLLLLSGRSARVHFQRAGAAAFDPKPDLAFDLPADSILYDTGDVVGDAGREIVVLRPASAEAISLAGRKLGREPLVLVSPVGAALRPDEDDLHWRPLCRDCDGAPGDEIFLPGADGIDVFRRDAASRAFVPAGSVKTGIVGAVEPGSGEGLVSRFRAAFGYPAIHVADLDGDGALDVAAATLESVAVHRGSKAPPFFGAAAPSRALRTGLAARRDRPSPSTPLVVDDADGDGRSDFLVVDGPAGTIRVHLAGAAGPDPESTPSQVLKIDGWILEATLSDVDGDGRRDLVLLSTPEVGVMEGARIVVEKTLRVRVAAFAASAPSPAPHAPFERTPTSSFEKSVPVSFATGGAARFEMISLPRPTIAGDFDGDGARDLLAPTGPDELGVFLGAKGKGLEFSDEPDATIHLGGTDAAPASAPPPAAPRPVEAWLRDLNGDGRTDIVLFQPDFGAKDRADRVTILLARA